MEVAAKLRSEAIQYYKQELLDQFDSKLDLPSLEEDNLLDVTCWVSPIDDMLLFDSDYLSQVTSMAGVTINGRPAFGIVNRPFFSPKTGHTYLGTMESGLFGFQTSYSDISVEPPKYIQPFEWRRSTEIALRKYPESIRVMAPVFAGLQEEIAGVEGVGNAFLSVLESRSDLLIDLLPSLHAWDTSAMEALLMAQMGFICDSKGLPLMYNS